MSLKRTRKQSSPDPLEGPVSDDLPISTPKTAKRLPRSSMPGPSTTPTPKRKTASKGTMSSSKRPRNSVPAESASANKKRKPLETQSPEPNDVVPVLIDRKGKGKESNSKSSNVNTPTRVIPSTTQKSASKSSVKRQTLGSSLRELPTPSPKIGKGKDTMRNFDEAFMGTSTSIKDPSISSLSSATGGPGGVAGISREVFLSNEALRRQREARNFKYDGDENAPKLTRSGKVVGKTPTKSKRLDSEIEDEDVYGSKEVIEEREGGLKLVDDEMLDSILSNNQIITSPSTPSRSKGKEKISNPLPEGAETLILEMIYNLNGANAARHPAPFRNEDTNETLNGLVNLLNGTVERGEGNSALVVGPRGTGKTRTMARALDLLPSTSKNAPIVVRLSGHSQVTDKLAIREMGRQIAEAEGKKFDDVPEEEDEGDEAAEYAPTTLPSHLLALLTASSPRAIIIVMEEFDLFTEHARQALLYCLLDVVQSVKTGPVESTGRGVAVIGLTSRTDTLLLLEKRVKSRFSHRIWRTTSPLSTGNIGWRALIMDALVPWKALMTSDDMEWDDNEENISDEMKLWKLDWGLSMQALVDTEKAERYLDRLSALTTDVRNIFRPFITPLYHILSRHLDVVTLPALTASVLSQVDGAGWGVSTSKLKGLSQPALVILIIVKHLSYAGRDEFNLAQVEEEYLRFARTRLVGSGKNRWPLGVLRMAYHQLISMSILCPIGNSNIKGHFAKVRCEISPHEIVAWFKGEGSGSVGPELGNWGRTIGGHA